MSGEAEPEDIEGIKIGALLPFTGELAASGASEEQAIRLVIGNRTSGAAELRA